MGAADIRQLELEIIEKLFPEERVELFSRFWQHCGFADNKCTCWNDE